MLARLVEQQDVVRVSYVQSPRCAIGQLEIAQGDLSPKQRHFDPTLTQNPTLYMGLQCDVSLMNHTLVMDVLEKVVLWWRWKGRGLWDR